MTPTDLDYILEKYLRLQLDEVESAKLEAWLSTMRIKNCSGDIISRSDEMELAQRICGTSTIADIASFRPRFYKAVPFIMNYRWLFSALLICFALLLGFLWTRSCVIPTNTSFIMSCQKLILNDGSIILMSHQSSLVFGQGEKQRRAAFTGEGLFEIRNVNGSPFLITLPNLILQIYGSCFIRTSASALYVQVLSGCAELIAANRANVASIRAGEQFSIVDGVRVKTVKETGQRIPPMYLHRYLMQFADARVSRIVARIQDKFDVTLCHHGGFSDFGNISVDFTNLSIRQTMDSFTHALDLDYTIHDDVVELYDRSNL